ncbi:hypothetical protein BDQ17DRAFT_1426585 [Cyathus striatus]|nr:hypothetical protein BDQ17DRAFT_1426585 [Cyathus striatus]
MSIPTVSASAPVPTLAVTTTTHHPAPSTVPYAATRHPDSVLSSPPPHHPAPPSFTLIVMTMTMPHHPVPLLFPLCHDDDDTTSPSTQATPLSSPLTTMPWPTAGEDSCCQHASRLHDITQHPISQRPRLHLCVVTTMMPWHPAGEDTVLCLISPSIPILPSCHIPSHLAPSSSPLHLDNDDSCQLVVPSSSLCVTAR